MICQKTDEISFQNEIPYNDRGQPSDSKYFPTLVMKNNNEKIPHVGIVFIPKMFDATSTLTSLLNDIESISQMFGIEEVFDETRHGTHRIIGQENMKILRDN